MDTINISELKIFAHHGVFDEEKRDGQEFIVNAVLFSDLEKAALSDDLRSTVNYAEVCETIRDVMKKNTYDLIETAAQDCAYAILRIFSRVCRVDIEVRKPNAPISMDFGYVSVKVSRSWHDVVLALGSNLGNKLDFINAALEKMDDSPMIKDMKVSKLLDTEPYGGVVQDRFLNGVVKLKTLYSPHGLLDFCHELENKAGRVRTVHWGPRTLDVDIIFYDDLVLNENDLVIPHPDMQNRDFVLAPLAEVAPEMVHPVLNKSVSALFRELTEGRR